jgi:hypothetical protein
MAFSLDIERMKCDIGQFVAAAGAEGAPCWRVFWPQCHTERAYTEHRAFGRSGFPFTSKEYTDPASVNYRKVKFNATASRPHVHLLAYPTFTEDDCRQVVPLPR